MVRRFSFISRLAGLTAAVAVAATVSTASATVFTGPTTLDQLALPGNSLQIGGLTFFNFSVTVHSGDMPAPAAVTVTPETLIIGSQSTVGFRLGGGFLDSAFSPGASDFGLSYEVSSLNGQSIISDAHLAGNPVVTVNGSATVTETWTPDIGNSFIQIFDLKPGNTNLSANVIFGSNFNHLHVQKDILLSVPDGSLGAATLSVVDQTFSTSVPEPASLGVLGLGALALIARRRR